MPQILFFKYKGNKSSEEIFDFHCFSELKNPMCGDLVKVKMFLENESIQNISAKVRGCALCEASAGLLVKIFKNHPIPIKNFLINFNEWLNDETLIIPSVMPKEFEVFHPIRAIKNRHKCITMPFEASFKALENIKYS